MLVGCAYGPESIDQGDIPSLSWKSPTQRMSGPQRAARVGQWMEEAEDKRPRMDKCKYGGILAPGSVRSETEVGVRLLFASARQEEWGAGRMGRCMSKARLQRQPVFVQEPCARTEVGFAVLEQGTGTLLELTRRPHGTMAYRTPSLGAPEADQDLDKAATAGPGCVAADARAEDDEGKRRELRSTVVEMVRELTSVARRFR